MPLSYPPLREVLVDGKTLWQATCRTCGQDVCSTPQAVKAAVIEARRAHGHEAVCTRADRKAIMSRIFTIQGKDVDIDDPKAIQALTNDEFTELFTIVKSTASADDDYAVPPTLVNREPGTGFIIPSTPPDADAGEER